jgi:hypothetical protein
VIVYRGGIQLLVLVHQTMRSCWQFLILRKATCLDKTALNYTCQQFGVVESVGLINDKSLMS